ncbi:MAG: selenoprotein B, partial [Actinomycetota bacterium]
MFEAEGLATIALGSQRNQIAGTAPPRGLWCDFPLGRPLGKPGDPEFQHRVLATAFSLLDADGPVFAEFPEAIVDDATEVMACPLP